MKSILFPFIYETDFRAAYAWSLELAIRLKCQLSMFTTMPDETRQHYSDLYTSLISARQFHVRKLGMSPAVKKPKAVVRNFVSGDFQSSFLNFMESSSFDVLVVPSETISEEVLTNLIRERKQIICLPAEAALIDTTQPGPTREAFFVDMLHRASCYNLPVSFYKTFGDDKSLFNSIATFFKRPEFDITKLTTG